MIPDHVKTREEAYGWLVRHGYSVDMANAELESWTPAEAAPAPAPVAEPVAEEVVEEAEEEEEEVAEEPSPVLGIFKKKK